MRLAELQQAFQAHVLAGDRAIAGVVPGTPGFATATRLAVYAEGYPERIVEALSQTYPALRSCLGEARFGALIRRLAYQLPSHEFSLRYYGRELPDLIATWRKSPSTLGAAELARWEWLVAEVFDAPDEAALGESALAAIEPARWPALTFTLTSSLRRLHLKSNAIRWWASVCAQAPKPSRWRVQRGAQWIAWRTGLTVRYRCVGSEERAALDAVADGETFGTICARMESASPARAALLLRRWLKDGLLTGVDG
ncbi:MAG TPA: DNA-binding domain-containing protein [Steroidobacteraceae bacterium]|nr:DNA-binding domain-containing protein [Steroidobacteraceae bacterium]